MVKVNRWPRCACRRTGRLVYTVTSRLCLTTIRSRSPIGWPGRRPRERAAHLRRKSSNDPHWLPDGTGIVFTSAFPSSRSSTSPLRGGEAEPLTSSKLEVGLRDLAYCRDRLHRVRREETKEESKAKMLSLATQTRIPRLLLAIDASATTQLATASSRGGDGTIIDVARLEVGLLQRVKTPPELLADLRLAIVTAPAARSRMVAARRRELSRASALRQCSRMSSATFPALGQQHARAAREPRHREKKDSPQHRLAAVHRRLFRRRQTVLVAKRAADRSGLLLGSPRQVVETSAPRTRVDLANLNDAATHIGWR